VPRSGHRVIDCAEGALECGGLDAAFAAFELAKLATVTRRGL
jgi:hypothetical protein